VFVDSPLATKIRAYIHDTIFKNNLNGNECLDLIKFDCQLLKEYDKESKRTENKLLPEVACVMEVEL
jgi:hypothetical protein